MEQAVRDGLITATPPASGAGSASTSWPRTNSTTPARSPCPTGRPAARHALVARSPTSYTGWGDVVIFAACTAARIGEVSGVRVKDIDTKNWIWTVRRQTTPSPGGLADKGTKGKLARRVPLIEEVRPMVAQRLLVLRDKPDARLFTGPRGGRITTAVLRDATHWDEVVRALGYEHLRRHDLRHTGLTWMADAGVPLHVLRLIAGHGSLTPPSATSTPTCKRSWTPAALLSEHLRRSQKVPNFGPSRSWRRAPLTPTRSIQGGGRPGLRTRKGRHPLVGDTARSRRRDDRI